MKSLPHGAWWHDNTTVFYILHACIYIMVLLFFIHYLPTHDRKGYRNVFSKYKCVSYLEWYTLVSKTHFDCQNDCTSTVHINLQPTKTVVPQVPQKTHPQSPFRIQTWYKTVKKAHQQPVQQHRQRFSQSPIGR